MYLIKLVIRARVSGFLWFFMVFYGGRNGRIGLPNLAIYDKIQMVVLSVAPGEVAASLRAFSLLNLQSVDLFLQTVHQIPNGFSIKLHIIQ